MTVKWYGNQFLAKLEVANEALLGKTARQVEAKTKVKINALNLIDTGFMVNTVYSATPNSSTAGKIWDEGRYQNREDEEVERERADEMIAKEGESLVHVAAAYFLYHELEHQILYSALVETANELKGK